MAARKKNRGNPNNPNTVLVLFMVFFILVSIGLGVMTYYGYAGQDKLKNDAESARKDAKSAWNASDYFRFQAMMGRAAEGGTFAQDEKTDEKNDFGVYIDGFDD